jgi:hypothetical protein
VLNFDLKYSYIRGILKIIFVGFKFLEALEKHPDDLETLYGIIVDEDEVSTLVPLEYTQ